MKVSNPEQANFVASFFQTPKADKADRSVVNDVSGLDQNDPSGFSKLLGVGRGEPAAKANSVARKDSLSSKVAASDRADCAAQSEQMGANSTSQSSASATDSINPQKSLEDVSLKDSLHSDQLLSDPRLQDPTELALEAAAAAAVAALSLGTPATKAPPVIAPGPVVSDLFGSVPSGPALPSPTLTISTPSTSPITDAALHAFQDKFRASGIVSVAAGFSNATPGNNVQPAVAGQLAAQQADAPIQVATVVQPSVQNANQTASDSTAAAPLPQFLPSADQGSVTIQVSPLLLDAVAEQTRAQFAAEQNQTALQALNGTAPEESVVQSSLLAAQGSLAAPVQVATPLQVSVATVARLLVPVVKELPRVSVPLAFVQVSPNSSSTAATAPLPNSQPQSAVVAQAVQPSNAVAEFFTAAQEAAQNAPKAGSSKLEVAVSSEKAVASNQAEVSPAALVQPQSAGEQTSNSNQGNFQGQSNAQQTQARPQRTGLSSDSAPESASPAPEAKHGTLGANDQVVAKENTPTQEQSTVETALVSSEDTVSRAVDLLPSDTSVSVPVHIHTPEVKSKPTVLPPVQVKAGEVWRTVQDAVQRARSENPNHLSVEVRLEDGSALGVELRMSSAGLQASFRSESQTLLKSIEAQWNGFVAKETADLKVVNASFEGNSNFGAGNFSQNGTSGGDRRQQMENNAASASLSRDFRAPASFEAAKGFPAADSVAPSQPSVEFLYA
ncbi:MAG: hypothetical protein WCK17_00690 [Verrucomicrobiota bacterium]